MRACVCCSGQPVTDARCSGAGLGVLRALVIIRMSGAGEQTDILSVTDLVRDRWRVVSCP